MPFGGTANPSSFSIPDSGDTQDVVISFIDVPGDESATETFAVGGQSIDVTLTIQAQNPESVSFEAPATVTRELVSIDDVQAVVRYTRT